VQWKYEKYKVNNLSVIKQITHNSREKKIYTIFRINTSIIKNKVKECISKNNPCLLSINLKLAQVATELLFYAQRFDNKCCP